MRFVDRGLVTPNPARPGVWDIEVLRVQILWRNLVLPYFKTLVLEALCVLVGGVALTTGLYYCTRHMLVQPSAAMDLETFAVSESMYR